MVQPALRARVVATRTLSPSVRSLALEFGSEPLRFKAGQWLNLHVPCGPEPGGAEPDSAATERALPSVEKRAYSIASAPGVRPLELAITHVASGSVSPRLHALAPGAELACDGPHGFFTHDGESRAAPTLFVGTGTGLSPLRSMLSELLRDPDHPPATLLFGVRTEADILWRDELEAWAARDPRFKLVVTLSQPTARWPGPRGYVQAHLAPLVPELASPHVFICGLSRMVGEVRALCKGELGLDRKRIHSERYD